jgi:hypothetical protein
MTGEYYFPEMTGQGGALFDYDNDGDLDLYLVQGSLLGPEETLEDALFPPPAGSAGSPIDRLLRNDLGDDGKIRLVDVTEASGLRAGGYGMGVATGDLDNDGHTDLYVTNYGPNQLWRNRGDGTFEDITAKAGADDPRWSTSAAFVDFDRDGWLDLYITNYLQFSVAENPACYANSSRRDYCGPSGFPPERDRLLRNRGDGTFQDVTVGAGITTPGAGLGVVAGDFDGDGWLDLYVANDGQPNFLWLNQQNGTFADGGLLSGLAVNARGLPEASMGVTAGDADGDGDLDLFMTHLTGETNTLYLQEEGGLFLDRTVASGLGAGSLPFTSFGTYFFDYDNDGWLDLLIANGAVRILEPLAAAGDLFPLDQPNQLYRNLGGGRFEEVTAEAGEPFRIAEVSRGAAVGDLDNDGDTDVVLFNNNGPARLLENRVGQDRQWIGLRLLSSPGQAGASKPLPARDALGTLVTVEGATQPRLVRRVGTDGSYCSANDPRLLFGLGDRKQPVTIKVAWPDGSEERFAGLAPGRYHQLHQGQGAESGEKTAPHSDAEESSGGEKPAPWESEASR